MSSQARDALVRWRIPLKLALALTLVMWLGYTVLFSLYLPEPLASLVGFIPGIVAVGVLLVVGFTPEACYLRFRSLSKPGLAVLAALFIPMIPVVWVGFRAAGLAGWDWNAVLIYAPASGVAQELYFRSALLPALQRALGSRGQALLGSSVLFALFHVGMFNVAPPGAAFAALAVTFVVGLGWGWQVGRDQTVVWAMVHHSLLQVVLRLFAWM